MRADEISEQRLRRAIRDHVARFWPNSVISEELWGRGPIEEQVPGFKVLKLKSKQSGKPVIYITSGCFIWEPTAHVKREFFLISPTEEIQHVETLTMLADFSADKQFTLDVGSVVSVGVPWMKDSKCNHLLISIPYPYGPKLEWLKTEDGCVRFLWVLPITEREAAFADVYGVAALEAKFEVVQLDYLDASRESII